MNLDSTPTSSTRSSDDARLIQQCAVLSAQAVAAEQAGDYRTAFGCYLRIIPLQDKLYSTDSVEAAVSFNGLGECALKMGEAGGAEEALSQALKVREDVSFGGMGLGTRHDAAVTRENMAQVKESQGKFLDARRLRLRGRGTDTMHCSDSKVSCTVEYIYHDLILKKKISARNRLSHWHP